METTPLLSPSAPHVDATRTPYIGGWDDDVGALFAASVDHAKCYGVLHGDAAAVYAAVEAVTQSVLLLVGLVGGSGGSLLSLIGGAAPWVAVAASVALLLSAVAHRLVARHRALANDWGAFALNLGAQLQLPRRQRVPLANCYQFYIGRYETLEARTFALVTVVETTAFRSRLASLRDGALQGLHVPERLGGPLTPTHERHDDGDACEPVEGEADLESGVRGGAPEPAQAPYAARSR